MITTPGVVMKGIQRISAVVATCGAVLGVAIGLAGMASADPLNGKYLATVTDGGTHMRVGSTQTVMFSPCGPDCTHIVKAPGITDLHLQGNTWTGTYAEDKSFGPCSYALDAATLDLFEQCNSFDLNVHYALTPK
jgi:hypothetical protein